MLMNTMQRDRSMRHARHTRLLSAGLLLAILSGTGCVEVGIPADGNKPHAELNPVQGMHASPAFKDQEIQIAYNSEKDRWDDSGMRTPPSETIHEKFRPYRYVGDTEGSKQLKNPVAITEDSLRYGKLLYETNCIVCHGKAGQGNGYVIGPEKYSQKPPTLTSQKVRNWEDGEIYHIITNGQGSMWSYKNNLYPVERWAVVNYVRALQRADFPEPQDLDRIRE